jgi:hypothetical protein
MMPPEPMRMVLVAWPASAMTSDGGGAGDALHAMMLGQPEAGIAGILGLLGHTPRAGERVSCGAALDDGAEIENGKGGHECLSVRCNLGIQCRKSCPHCQNDFAQRMFVFGLFTFSMEWSVMSQIGFSHGRGDSNHRR